MNSSNFFRWPALAWAAALVLNLQTLPADAQVVPTLSVNDLQVVEGNTGTQRADFTVTLSAASASNVEVTYAIIDGTANRFTDFTPATQGGILRFPPGTTQQIVTNLVRGDTLSEANEVFYLQLYFPVNATFLRDHATCTILNDDGGYASVFVVTNTAQTGPGSLRQAILNANATPQRDLIIFNIGLGGRVAISPTNPLPTITAPVIIDGTTQAGYDGRPTVTIDGTRRYLLPVTYGPIHGLLITAGDSEVRGLALSGWQALIPNDTWAGSGLFLRDRGHNVVRGCYLGIDATGRWAVSNGVDGLTISNASFNVIGGTEPWMRNVISGNMRYGIYILNGSTNEILGNYIGIDAPGTNAVGNRVGISISAYGLRSQSNIVGGAISGAGNVISGNQQQGISITDSPNLVAGNFIGLDSAGQMAVNNGGHGIAILAPSCQVGGFSPGEGNRIAYNGGTGVLIAGTSGNLVVGNTIFAKRTNGVTVGWASPLPPTRGNTLVANSIFDNDFLGIDLVTQSGAWGRVTLNDALDGDDGPNQAQNFPEIVGFTLSGGSVRINGTLNSQQNRTYRLDLYRSNNADPSGYGEGAIPLGNTTVTTTGGGTASFAFVAPAGLAPGDYVTATATDSDGSTSEFSPAVRFAGFPTLSVANASIVEGNSGWSDLNFTVTLAGPTLAQVEVDYATVDGTAVSGPGSLDYQAVSGRLIMPAGPPTPYFVRVPVRGELLQEADEVFYLQLSTPVNAYLPASPATGTILDDDTPLRLVVTSAAGSGPGSLAQAIQTANARPGLDFITFSPALTTITLTNPLPDVTDALNINGFISSLGRTGAVRRIELSGPRPGPSVFPGLRLAANDCVVRGMVINNFNGPGIHLFRSTNSVIATNYLGTDRAGTAAKPNSHGILVEDCESCLINQENVISGNLGPGVAVQTSANISIQGNLIGVTATGSAPLGNATGIILTNSANNRVGGQAPGEGNVVSGNVLDGIHLTGPGTVVNDLIGNRIGTDRTGSRPLPNGSSGVLIEGQASGNGIGFPAPPIGNIIAYNGREGVAVLDAPDNRLFNNRIFQNGRNGVLLMGAQATGIPIVQNAIFDNGQLGINLQPIGEANHTPTTNALPAPGPNNLLPMPVNLVVADCNTNTDLTGSLPAPLPSGVVIHLYASQSPDPSGFGEGQMPIYWSPAGPLVEVVVPAGVTAFSTNFAGRFPYWHFTATTHHPLTGDTSEFSRPVESLPTEIRVVVTPVGLDVDIYFNTVTAVGGQTRFYEVWSSPTPGGPWSPVPGLTKQGTGKREKLTHQISGAAGLGFYEVRCR